MQNPVADVKCQFVGERIAVFFRLPLGGVEGDHEIARNPLPALSLWQRDGSVWKRNHIRRPIVLEMPPIDHTDFGIGGEEDAECRFAQTQSL